MADLSIEALAVIEKVKKLLALANGNANEHEAEAASTKAMDLLAAYNLSMAVIDRPSSDRKDQKRKGGLYSWQRDLWKAVCELNFCMYWADRGLVKGSSYEHRILGRQENVISAEVLADYLQHTIERLAQAWAKQNGYNSVFVREAIAYREGMADRLCSRLQRLRLDRLAEDERKQREANSRPSAPGLNALVLASVINSEQDLNTDYLNGWEPGTAAAKRARSEAWYAEIRAKNEAERQARDAAELANPELKAARLAEEAREQARWDKKYGGRTYRERAPTAREQRSYLSSHTEGYRKADDIGLDKQVKTGDSTSRLG